MDAPTALTVTLPAELARFVEESVASGSYSDAGEVVQAALQLLQIQPAEREGKLEALRQDLFVALKEIERGEGTEFNPEAIKREVHEELARHDGLRSSA